MENLDLSNEFTPNGFEVQCLMRVASLKERSAIAREQSSEIWGDASAIVERIVQLVAEADVMKTSRDKQTDG